MSAGSPPNGIPESPDLERPDLERPDLERPDVERPDLEGPIPEGKEPSEYDRARRRVLWSIPNGLFLLGSRHGDRLNLMTVSFVTQVSIHPKLIGVGVENSSYSEGLLHASGIFSLSFISREDRAIVRRFVKPVTPEEIDFDPVTGLGSIRQIAIKTAATGAPVMADGAGWIDCEIRQSPDLGSHTFFIGEVVDVGEPAVALESGILKMEDTRMSYGG